MCRNGENMVAGLRQTENAACLFDGWQETMIWSCLQGVMGNIYVDSQDTPVSGIAVLGDFCFLAGKPDRELLCGLRGRRDFMIMVPRGEEWGRLIEECYREKARRVVRYAIKKEPDVFDCGKLQAIVDGLPGGYTLEMVDEALFRRCGEIGWCRDWVAQYPDYAAYREHGMGAVILKDGEPVSGASSYSGYIGGIEIEIDTREDFRRKGLARICGAKLILECLNRGWYPAWDAQNKGSAALAEELGYHIDSAYTAYEITV